MPPGRCFLERQYPGQVSTQSFCRVHNNSCMEHYHQPYSLVLSTANHLEPAIVQPPEALRLFIFLMRGQVRI